jgi:hypothetical protein
VTKTELATQLRDRMKSRIKNDPQFRHGLTEYEEDEIDPEVILMAIDRTDDDAIIDAYMTCADCGEKLAEGAEFERIIADCHCQADFSAYCLAAADERGCRFHWSEEIEIENEEKGAAK